MQQHKKDDSYTWVPLWAAFAPFLAWPVEMILPYPWLVEELIKGVLVWKVITSADPADAAKLAISIGVLFGGSELLLFVVNAILAGSFGPLVGRLLLTIPMHVLTAFLVYWFGRKGTFGFGIGLAIAMAVHFSFNLLAS
jgi:hypothetical protein